jgi:uncharacterized protein YodC (DUF2158 family)
MTDRDPHVAKVLSENPIFEVGDVVRLKSGGPSMMIRSIDGNEIFCEWFDKAVPRSHSFLKAQLAHTTPEQTPILNVNYGGDAGDVPPWKRVETDEKDNK